MSFSSSTNKILYVCFNTVVLEDFLSKKTMLNLFVLGLNYLTHAKIKCILMLLL